ncbi:MAG TPA: UvrD-helicase domain-containing protein [Dissulfurispiraceae bacterium]|nr:UvrD-helicase domain-containing protein [Dissulfurispiraceae bacterium]
MAEALDKDTALCFPHVLVLKASAGTGKTYALSRRFVQFLLLPEVPHNRLKNILAVTFSNNAAQEMRRRIVFLLKRLALGEQIMMQEFSGLIASESSALQRRAEAVLESILDHYGDFQVKTIDSFMTTLFQASAVDLGFPPDFEITLDGSATIEFAFQRFLHKASEGTAQADLLVSVVRQIAERKQKDGTYLWDPFNALLEEVTMLAQTGAAFGRKPALTGCAIDEKNILARFRTSVSALQLLITQSGLVPSGNSSWRLSDMPGIAQSGRLVELLGKKLHAKPVKLPRKTDNSACSAYEEIERIWEDIRQSVQEYAGLHAHTYYEPFVRIFTAFAGTLDEVKRRQGILFIEDINAYLAEYLSGYIVPDIYFRMGESLFHFFIDEFQDTSPIQWRNLRPLLENAVAEGGSLFVVGDTKQAIYGFRNADYRIMAELQSRNEFPAAEYRSRELTDNYRSGGRILDLPALVFRERAQEIEEYRTASRLSGLHDFSQQAAPGRADDGYVTLTLVAKDAEATAEKDALCGRIEEVRRRGIPLGSVVVLTQRNEDAVRCSEWLNEKGISFVSLSSLDIRQRSLTGELIALLRFLDDPTDTLSFATFLLGDIFSRHLHVREARVSTDSLAALVMEARMQKRAAYTLFAEQYPAVWASSLSDLMRLVGYLPLYDLLSEIYQVFDLLSLFIHEEAALVRLLETVKDFEGQGSNSLGAFLQFAASEEMGSRMWQMSIPPEQDSVRIMTIHKAKGLGFPVVVLMLAEQRRHSPDPIVVEEGDCIGLHRITAAMAAAHPELLPEYEKASVRSLADNLNALYVGLTRAQDELHIIGSAAHCNKLGYPLDLLPFDQPVFGQPSLQQCRPERLASRQTIKPAWLEPTRRTWQAEGGSLRLYERRRGECMHILLSRINALDMGWEERAMQDATRLAARFSACSVADDIARPVIEFLNLPDAGRFFRRAPGRVFLTEYDIVGANGSLYRIDRLVVDPDSVSIVDYKSGYEAKDNSSGLAQIRRYVKLVHDIYPGRTVVGYLASLKGRFIRRIT